jgi:parvulin-like peptidyl-prolyl isomerase
MTLRSRQGPNRSRSLSDSDRRNFYMNIAFGVIVAASLLILVVAAGAAYWDGHLSAAVKVNSQEFSKDAVLKQAKINSFLLDVQRKRTRTLLAENHLWSTDANARIQGIESQAAQVETLAANQLIDGTIQLDLASKQGITVTDADIDAQLARLAETPELRHVWLIAVVPTLQSGQSAPTAAQKTEAKAKAQQALTALKGGGDWAKIAAAFSTDASKDQGGDIGFIDETSTLDEVYTSTMMKAIPNQVSDLIEGLDGGYRIGRVTEILPAAAGANIVEQAKAEGIDANDLRAAVKFAAANEKLSKSITDAALAPGPQRHVAQIYMQNSASETGPSAIRVRHILYSPNHDPNAAAKVAPADPAWAAAKALADATYAKLQKDPTQFDAIARAESDEAAARTSGGKLPYFSTNDGIDQAFADAVLKPGLEPDQLLAPVKSSFGYHVIQVMHYPTDADWAAKLVTRATSADAFAKLARDNSDLASAADGGDIGWVSKGQLADGLKEPVFAAPIGKVSQPTTVASDGLYIFWVFAEETRAPDALQTAKIKASAFSDWYSKNKTGYTTWEDPALTAASGG